ncbi:MAG: RluA family pseudouridine synthase [Erysipelotrichaceae bacterium]|nr:RluA family pseudouridine synthase [Erysipelotrichaceae bacterium]
MPKINLIVDEDCAGERVDLFLAENTLLSRSQIQKLIKEGKVLINGYPTKSKYPIVTDDEIEIDYKDKTETDIMPEDIPLDIVYEDADVIVVNKPKGLVVHPAPGNPDGTLVNALLYHCHDLSDVNGYYRPGIVHRIDKDTSGLLVVAKNNNAHTFLAQQLKDKTCYRKYLAIVKGVIENKEGEINAPIGRSTKDRQKMAVTDKNSKDALTLFKVIRRFHDSTLIECELKTGRTHQIRVHMAFINHPVLNDGKYSSKTIDETGQYLHAYYLSFIHPTTKERMEFSTELPSYMKEYIENKGEINV